MKYEIIYADPPWSYDSKQDDYNGKPIHYPGMTIDRLKQMPIESLSAENCALFLWCVPALLPEAFEVGAAWGFKYKTKGFCWAKKNKKADSFFFGQGYYTRSNTEDCLLFLRGRMKRSHNSVRQLVATPIERHSRKPDAVRFGIEQLFGVRPRLELFARERHLGWDAWGDEVENPIEIPGFPLVSRPLDAPSRDFSASPAPFYPEKRKTRQIAS